MKRIVVAGLVLGIVWTVAAAQQSQSPEALLGAAIHQEEVEGKLEAAIASYKKVVADSRASRALVAAALFHLGRCYEKLGSAESSNYYERVMRDFADQKEAGEARARLAAGRPPASAPSSETARLVWRGQDALGAVRGSPSSDGRYLTFLGTAGALAIRDLKDGTSRILAKDSSGSFGTFYYSAFSPDNRQVAYAWSRRTQDDVKFDLRVIPLAAGENIQPRIIYQNDEMTQIRPYGWTPDATQILVLRSLRDGTSQIAMVSVRDGATRVLKSIPWSYITMSLSPDGRYIAYDALGGDNKLPTEIFVLAADASRETLVVPGPAGNSSPLWSPDGSGILFLSDRTGKSSLMMLPIEEGRARGPAELIKADIGQVRLQGLTGTGTLFYLAPGNIRSNIYTADLDASLKAAGAPIPATERFVSSNSAATWSPDGQYLAYLSSRGPNVNGSPSTVLVIQTLKTGEERDLPLPAGFMTGAFISSPKWFPGGRSILVSGSAGKGTAYYRVDLGSGKMELIHAPKGAYGGGGLGANALSPDGKIVFYIAAIDESTVVDEKVVRFDIETRTETVLKTGQLFASIALSPDGSQLAVTRNEQGCHLEVMPASGGPARDVFTAKGCGATNVLAWSPDQHYLLFENPATSKLVRIPVAGGDPEPIGISIAGQIRYPAMHPNGGRIAFTSFETGASEVWVLENFLKKN
jgi:Tol biopolymer transport system component